MSRSPHRSPRTLVAGLAAAVALAGCSGGSPTASLGGPDQTQSPSGVVSPGAAGRSGAAEAEVPPPPREGSCYALTLDQALAATSDVEDRDCSARHTARTYLVGEVDAVVDGHLLAIDSDAVQAQVAEDCPAALSAFLGGGVEAQRLSVLRPVWFTPSLQEADAGASWFRCDVVAVDASGGAPGLTELGGRLAGVLARGAGRERWGLCATGAPDEEGALRVPCSAAHSWRAVAVVDLGRGDYPGRDTARRTGQDRCERIGRERAEDPLTFRWGYEWPTEQQWEAGQTFGRCWVPSG